MVDVKNAVVNPTEGFNEVQIKRYNSLVAMRKTGESVEEYNEARATTANECQMTLAEFDEAVEQTLMKMVLASLIRRMA